MTTQALRKQIIELVSNTEDEALLLSIVTLLEKIQVNETKQSTTVTGANFTEEDIVQILLGSKIQ
ncbi:MAG: hypothetical protein IT270_01095 [Saprospiraceae bacterium]|nr:hypothetical protein [Saprospiraceae bacterium]